MNMDVHTTFLNFSVFSCALHRVFELQLFILCLSLWARKMFLCCVSHIIFVTPVTRLINKISAANVFLI